MSINQYSDEDDIIIKGDDGSESGIKIGAVGNALKSNDSQLVTTNASLAAIDAGIPTALGQTTMAASMSVAIASNQSTLPVSLATSTTISTYSAAISGLVVAAAATDVFTISGSASKNIKITMVSVSASTTAGSGTSINLRLVKRSTLDTSGTSTVQTNVPYDSNNAAATVVVRAYTANPTLGTEVGNVATQRFAIPTVGAGGRGPSTAVFTFGFGPTQPIVLRNANEQICVNFGGATITNPVIAITIEWSEE